ncbi:Transcriptional repressor PaaX [Defluviimonas aquaemixtae]|uniref:Transcriptional repressor PaaX n=1 Tax=Albidovulum aquaemixtae TaxID=1542388 RepID=A0A2R8BMM1_9RHOB|nr:PaaX family transcriptional regulator C-terminal domain-containing protein [Defluviimonas aquaemixtae]SPH24654.1 Transcriptional repressor PaaX [Defluviimonas aquaemixtae]
MDPLAPLIDALHAEGRPRVWSLVITVMGDAVQPRGGRVALARLALILGRLGVEPGALRTALSRLARDGWVVRERTGRVSHYRLSARGLAEYEPAARRIYAAPAKTPVVWTLALTEDAADGFSLGGGLSLISGPEAKAGTALSVTGGLRCAPGIGTKLMPPEQRTALDRLFADLDCLDPAELSPGDAMAARTLLIHRWRRISLRWPDLPAPLAPVPPGPARPRVAAAYRRLLPVSEAWLSDPETGAEPLPGADASLARRFTQS